MTVEIRSLRPAVGSHNTDYSLPSAGTMVDGKDNALGIVAGQASKEVSRAQLDKAVKAMNDTVAANNLHFQFSVHEGTHRVIVQVIDRETDQVVQEIPPERILDIISQMGEMLGVLVDEKA